MVIALHIMFAQNLGIIDHLILLPYTLAALSAMKMGTSEK